MKQRQEKNKGENENRTSGTRSPGTRAQRMRAHGKLPSRKPAIKPPGHAATSDLKGLRFSCERMKRNFGPRVRTRGNAAGWLAMDATMSRQPTTGTWRSHCRGRHVPGPWNENRWAGPGFLDVQLVYFRAPGEWGHAPPVGLSDPMRLAAMMTTRNPLRRAAYTQIGKCWGHAAQKPPPSRQCPLVLCPRDCWRASFDVGRSLCRALPGERWWPMAGPVAGCSVPGGLGWRETGMGVAPLFREIARLTRRGPIATFDADRPAGSMARTCSRGRGRL